MSLFSDYSVRRRVPDFVGLDYDAATDLERSLGLHIAGSDPDASPISNSWWENRELVVLTQSPPPGSWIDRQVSVVVTLGPSQVPVGARVRGVVPPALSAEAQTEAITRARPPAERA